LLAIEEQSQRKGRLSLSELRIYNRRTGVEKERLASRLMKF